MKSLRLALAPLVWVLLGGPVQSAQATAAVAASFAGTARTLSADFTRDSGHTLHIASGATGGLYTKIRQGVPYELFLAADRDRPAPIDPDLRHLAIAEPTLATYGAAALSTLATRPAHSRGSHFAVPVGERAPC